MNWGSLDGDVCIVVGVFALLDILKALFAKCQFSNFVWLEWLCLCDIEQDVSLEGVGWIFVCVFVLLIILDATLDACELSWFVQLEWLCSCNVELNVESVSVS